MQNLAESCRNSKNLENSSIAASERIIGLVTTGQGSSGYFQVQHIQQELLVERLIKSQDFMGQAPSVLKSFAFYTKSPYCSKLKFMNKNERKKEVLLAQSTQRDKKRINYSGRKTHVLL